MGQLVLQIEDVFDSPVEFLGPHLTAGFRIDQLRRHANALAGSSNTPFDNVARAEFLSDLANVGRLPLVGLDGVPRDHGERSP